MFLITGGTHGIGEAIVRRLVLDNQKLVFTGRDEASGRALEAELSGATFMQGDVASEADCQRIVEATVALSNGKLSGLVNNAGTSARSAFSEASAADWDRVMAVNARSAFLFIRHALPALIAARGSVVNMSSIAGKVGEEGLAIYCASKAALLGLTQALALEYGQQVR